MEALSGVKLIQKLTILSASNSSISRKNSSLCQTMSLFREELMFPHPSESMEELTSLKEGVLTTVLFTITTIQQKVLPCQISVSQGRTFFTPIRQTKDRAVRVDRFRRPQTSAQSYPNTTLLRWWIAKLTKLRRLNLRITCSIPLQKKRNTNQLVQQEASRLEKPPWLKIHYHTSRLEKMRPREWII